MKLISMTTFVLEQEILLRNNSDYTNAEAIFKCINYANFLKEPLTLGMFVPCDDNGNVLENISGHGLITNYSKKVKEYQEAQSKVLFNGFNTALNSENCQISVINNSFRASIIYSSRASIIYERYYPSHQEKVKTIEDLIPYNLVLSVSF